MIDKEVSKRKMTSKKYIVPLVILAVTFIYTYFIGNSTFQDYLKNIKTHQKITIGVITDFIPELFGQNYEYRFTINGKIYVIKHNADASIDWRGKIGLTYPVIYDSLDPENYSELLIYSDEFKRFNINPDSLEKIGKLKWNRE